MPRSKIDSWLMQQNGKPADPDNPLPLTATAQAQYSNVPREGGGMMVAYSSFSAALREIELKRTDYESARIADQNGYEPENTPDGYGVVRSHLVEFAGTVSHRIFTFMRDSHEPRLFTIEEVA